ncbi:MAG: hypothetical protein EHM28_07640 [Spirochaetaceae bacterium]|nr:MAG: hypothetical protein EHM28_07640 [Spirochaetaceae bacterium]
MKKAKLIFIVALLAVFGIGLLGSCTEPVATGTGVEAEASRGILGYIYDYYMYCLSGKYMYRSGGAAIVTTAASKFWDPVVLSISGKTIYVLRLKYTSGSYFLQYVCEDDGSDQPWDNHVLQLIWVAAADEEWFISHITSPYMFRIVHKKNVGAIQYMTFSCYNPEYADDHMYNKFYISHNGSQPTSVYQEGTPSASTFWWRLYK